MNEEKMEVPTLTFEPFSEEAPAAQMQKAPNQPPAPVFEESTLTAGERGWWTISPPKSNWTIPP